MTLSRRQFLKIGGTTSALLAAGVHPAPVLATPPPTRVKWTQETASICPYCAVGCGMIVGTADGKVVNIEGDPDHPINGGALCSKGSSMRQVADNPERLTRPLYRAPGSDHWEEKEWGWTLDQIAQRIKSTRDANWIEKDKDGKLVNRTEALAWLGGAALDNEECALSVKFARSLGLVYIEHQARLCHSSTVPALAESFGRGAMTNHWIDIRNADVILVMGCNPAGNHPISFRWITEAMERGATLISVDPRFTRTSAKADIYAPLRPGTDVAFLGGMINYILENKLYHEEYVREYTNAPMLINPDFAFDEGLFSGYDPEQRKYDKATWTYQMDESGIPRRDPTLQDPQSVFQLLKKHFSRYDLDTVASITGTPRDRLLAVYQAYAATGAPDKVGTMMYAMGWTQHTVGTQNIRASAIIQLLLGNMGRAGGGINALRGESNVQASTDHALLYHILPGYLKSILPADETLEKYLERTTPKSNDPASTNWWQNTPKYMVSLLKAWYSDNATPENEFGFQWLPKGGGNYSWLNLFKTMSEGGIKGLLVFGQNPAVSSANAGVAQTAFNNLDWMVSANLWNIETANFWQRPGVNPADVKTEVFMLPAAASFEKQGSLTNSGRWAQWRWKAVDPPGEARSDSWILNQLMLRLRKLYESEGGPNADAITRLNWDYGDDEPDIEKVAREINGWAVTDVKDKDGNLVVGAGKQVKNFTQLQADGSTACANWVFSGSYNEDGNMMARRDNTDTHPAGIGLFSKWSWSWPVNRRIIYNRASVNLAGEPFDPKRWVIRWDATANEGKGDWVGDVVDGGGGPGARHPFIMVPEGYGRLFGPGLADGPFPEHYEPWESPVENILHPSVDINPACVIYPEAVNPRGNVEEYPIVATTHRLSEHWQTGAMTRHQPWLLELQPEMFVTLSQALADEHGIQSGDKIFVESARSRIEVVAYVTGRMPVLQVNGRQVHVIAMPWHWGFMGLEKPGGYGSGASANLLTVFMGDANTTIPESKAFLCRIGKV